MSATAAVCHEKGIAFQEVWGKSSNSRHYYVHGKDNIPFHTIILPSLLLAHGGNWRLPDDIISSEYVTLEGKKISTSQNWAVWTKDLLQEYHPDSIRFFFLANGPEKRDADFSWKEFKKQNNSELVGAWGNLVNRTLVFCARYLDNVIPSAGIHEEISQRISKLFDSVGNAIENGAFREAIGEIFETVRYSNAFYDAGQPWKTRVSNPDECKATIANCVYLVANLSILLHPFLPFSSGKIARWLGITPDWHEQRVTESIVPADLSILFSRIS